MLLISSHSDTEVDYEMHYYGDNDEEYKKPVVFGRKLRKCNTSEHIKNKRLNHMNTDVKSAFIRMVYNYYIGMIGTEK